MNHFISIADTPAEELRHVLDISYKLKKQLKSTGRNDPLLAGKTLAMIFEKPSLRTRVSFAVAIEQLGGNGLLLRDEEVGLDKREATEDVARVLASMCDGIMARTFEHEKVIKLAKYSKVPVINALTDYSHPCQAMADLMTIEEHFGDLKGRTIAYIGDGNNVARSLAVACGKFGMNFIIAAPLGYELDTKSVERIKAQVPGINYTLVRDSADAAKNADVLYTDTWVSMGQEEQKAQRVEDFKGFQINQALLNNAPKHCIVLHCLPAYRGLEITADIMKDPRSLVFQEAENRLHFQKGLIAVLMGGM
ncbi:MAG TPA: ornithine carbamoyltransferase [Tepidisphaeraceae bacterium]|jgi:ornithine carbamoyltransferase